MNKPIHELKPEAQMALMNQLRDQANEAFNKMEEVGKLHTQHLFLVNAGGAVAVLAFIGAKTNSAFAIWPLMFFVVGVIACGIQLLMMIYVYKELFNGALIRRNKFEEEDATVEDILPKVEDVNDLIYQIIARRAYFTAQGSFIVGVFAGGIAYIC